MNKLHIIAGILAVFFLTVAIAKSFMKAAAKREAKRKTVENAKNDSVSLHNPYPGEIPDTTPANDEPAEAARPEEPPAAPAAAPSPPPTPTPPQEQPYKWN